MHPTRVLFVWSILVAMTAGPGDRAEASGGDDPAEPPGVVAAEFLFEDAPFRQCHASTIAETRGGLVAAWFGGTREGDDDVGIWVARHDGGAWTVPVEVADGRQDDGTRLPCWNPVLFQTAEGPLLLFFKVGPDPRRWWGLLATSDDGGTSWTPPRRLPPGILGPIKNKPIPRPDGALLCPSSTEDQGWRVHFERTADGGRSWERIGPIHDGREFGAIQPTLLTHADGRLQALCRSRQAKITESWSADGGRTWGAMTATALPNPNAGIDAVTLADGRQLLVYNHTTAGRSPLNVAVSADGRAWRAALVLEEPPGEYSYPAVIQASDGLVHITYTWKRRRIRHVAVDPARLALRDMPDGRWPAPAPPPPPDESR
jgi:predicted neuraminidase